MLIHKLEPVAFEQEINKLAEKTYPEPQPLTIEAAETRIPIHSICMYKDLVFVGSELGDVKVFFDRKIYHLPQVHTRSVEVLEIVGDEVWSAGCDCRIFRWDCTLIHEEIANNAPTTVMSQCEIFHEERTTEKYVITNENVCTERTGFPRHHEGISSLLVNGSLFAVGYYKGELYIDKGGVTTEVRAHSEMVSCLKLRDQSLFSSSADGMLKRYNLATMELEKGFVQVNSPIIAFSLCEGEISVVSMNGFINVIKYDFMPACVPKRVSKSEIYSYYK